MSEIEFGTTQSQEIKLFDINSLSRPKGILSRHGSVVQPRTHRRRRYVLEVAPGHLLRNKSRNNSRSNSPDKLVWQDLLDPVVFVHPKMPANIAECEVKSYLKNINLKNATLNLNDLDTEANLRGSMDNDRNNNQLMDDMDLLSNRVLKLKKIKEKSNSFGFDNLSHYQFFLNLSLRKGLSSITPHFAFKG